MMHANQIKVNKIGLDKLWNWACLLLLTCACSSETNSVNTTTTSSSATDHIGNPYFSLESYFSGEIDRLTSLDNPVKKTVSINGETESQTLRISNWRHELDPFLGADINKAAWKTSYSIDSIENVLVYRALEPDLKTRKITIEKDSGGQVRRIEMENELVNWIYQSKEQLKYVPDSLYEIKKQQTIRIVGTNEYHILVRKEPKKSELPN